MKNFKVRDFNTWVAESKEFNIAHTSVEATRLLAEALLQKDGFTDEELLCFYTLRESNMSIYEFTSLDEGLLDKLQSVGKSIIDGGKDAFTKIKTVVGKELSGVPEFFKAVASGLKNLIKYIVDFLGKAVSTMFGKPVDWVKSALGAKFTELEKAVGEEVKKEASKFKTEATGLVPIVTASHKLLIPSAIGSSLEKGLSSVDSKEVKTSELEIVEESLKTSILMAITEAVKVHNIDEIHEGFDALTDDTDVSESEGHSKIPFVSTISSILEKMPPFSWLTMLAHFFEKNINKALSKISSLLKEKGHTKEAIEFVIIGSLVGLGLEYLIKSGVKSAIGYFFPPLHAVLIVLGTIATAICVVHIASNLIDGLKDVDKEIMSQSSKMAH